MANLKAELAAMEEEEAAEVQHRQEHEKKKKKKIAKLADTKKAEEAAAVEATWKATRKAAKWCAERQEENTKMPAAKKQKSTDEVNGAEELAWEACQRCITIFLDFSCPKFFFLDAIWWRLVRLHLSCGIMRQDL